MATTTENRTTSWLNSHNFHKRAKEEAVPADTDAPLDFSKKKRQCSPEDDSISDVGSSASSHKRGAESPPVSMADFNNLRNSLSAFPQAFFPQLANASLPPFPFTNFVAEPRGNKSSKPVRPFKAYPREPMQFPMNLWMMQKSIESGFPMMDSFSQYKRAAELTGRRSGPVTNGKMARTSKRKSKTMDDRPKTMGELLDAPVHNQIINQTVPNTAACTTKEPSMDKSDSGSPKSQIALVDSTGAGMPATPGNVNDSDRSGSKSPESAAGSAKKRPQSITDESKDAAYWERRRKNNEAAKRSRDSRRAKEDEIALRAGYLETENLQLRVQIETLRAENAKFRNMLVLN